MTFMIYCVSPVHPLCVAIFSAVSHCDKIIVYFIQFCWQQYHPLCTNGPIKQDRLAKIVSLSERYPIHWVFQCLLPQRKDVYFQSGFSVYLKYFVTWNLCLACLWSKIGNFQDSVVIGKSTTVPITTWMFNTTSTSFQIRYCLVLYFKGHQNY